MHRHRQDNLEADEGKLQAVAGEGKLGKGYIGGYVHDLAMENADAYP